MLAQGLPGPSCAVRPWSRRWQFQKSSLCRLQGSSRPSILDHYLCAAQCHTNGHTPSSFSLWRQVKVAHSLQLKCYKGFRNLFKKPKNQNELFTLQIYRWLLNDPCSTPRFLEKRITRSNSEKSVCFQLKYLTDSLAHWISLSFCFPVLGWWFTSF